MNAQYPVLSQQNLSLLQQPVAPQTVTPAPMQAVQMPEVAQPLSSIEAQLEPVQTNQKFLKKLAQSKKKVQKEARSLKRFSYGMGGVAALLAVGSLVSAMTLKYQAKKADMDAEAAGPHHLQSGKKLFDLHSLSWSSMISTMIWTLVAAKAKQGVNAANKPESGSIKIAAKKGIFCIVLIALAAGMKFAGDNKMLDEFFEDNVKGISLAQKINKPTLQSHNDEFENPLWMQEEDQEESLPEEFEPEWDGEWEDEEEDFEDFEDDIEDDEDFEDMEQEIEDLQKEIEEMKQDWQPRRKHDRRQQDWEDDEGDWETPRHNRHRKHEEDDWEPRRSHGKKHGRGHKRGGHNLAAPKTLYQTMTEKYQNNPQSFKSSIKVAGAFTGIFIVALVVSYMSLLNTYKKSVAKHEFLLTIYQNPNAKVVPQHAAKEFIAHKTLEARQNKAVKAQAAAQEIYNQKMAAIQQQQMMLFAQNPVAAYTPPKVDEEANKNEFNYSICESIDYQQSTLKTEAPTPVPEVESIVEAPTLAVENSSVTLSREQFEALVKIAPQLSALGVQTKANSLE